MSQLADVQIQIEPDGPWINWLVNQHPNMARERADYLKTNRTVVGIKIINYELLFKSEEIIK